MWILSPWARPWQIGARWFLSDQATFCPLVSSARQSIFCQGLSDQTRLLLRSAQCSGKKFFQVFEIPLRVQYFSVYCLESGIPRVFSCYNRIEPTRYLPRPQPSYQPQYQLLLDSLSCRFIYHRVRRGLLLRKNVFRMQYNKPCHRQVLFNCYSWSFRTRMQYKYNRGYNWSGAIEMSVSGQ